MAEIKYMVTKDELKRKLATGIVTQEDVDTAHEYARKFSAPDNIALYAKVVRAREALLADEA